MSDETLVTCPVIVFDLTNQDLSAFDTQVFTLTTTTGSQTLTTATSLEAKIGTYNLRLLAKYEGTQYSTAGQLDFTVEVLDPCLYGFVTIAPAASQTNPTSYLYTADAPLATFSLTAFTTSPAWCVQTYSCSV